jgi:hypothetical protein
MGTCLKIVNVYAYKQQACQRHATEYEDNRDRYTTAGKSRVGTGPWLPTPTGANGAAAGGRRGEAPIP